jgi:oligosaccharide repeat unit polymerase
MMSIKAEYVFQKRVTAILRWALLAATFVVASHVSGLKLAFLSTLVLYCSLRLLQRTTTLFASRRITIVSFWYLSYLAMIFLPAFYVFSDQEGPFRASYLFAVESVLITVPFGVLAASWLLGFRKQETDHFFLDLPKAPKLEGHIAKIFFALFGIGLVAAFIHLSELKAVPVLYLFRNPGDYLYSSVLREDSLKLLNSPRTYLYYVVERSIFPFLIMVSLGCYLLTRQRKWFWMLLTSLITGVLYASVSLEKGPVAAIFLLLGFFLYIYHRGRVHFKAVVATVVLTLSFPFVVVSFLYGESGVDAWGVLQALAGRLFYSPAEVLYYYFEVFPSHIGYLHGSSIGKLAWLSGIKYFDTANYVGIYGWPQYAESISANATFIGNLHADFGIPGVLVGGVLAGFIMQWSHIHLIRRQKSVFSIACYAFLVLAFWFLNSTALPVVLASDGVILVLFLTWVFDREGRSYITHSSRFAPRLAPRSREA